MVPAPIVVVLLVIMPTPKVVVLSVKVPLLTEVVVLLVMVQKYAMDSRVVKTLNHTILKMRQL